MAKFLILIFGALFLQTLANGKNIPAKKQGFYNLGLEASQVSSGIDYASSISIADSPLNDPVSASLYALSHVDTAGIYDNQWNNTNVGVVEAGSLAWASANGTNSASTNLTDLGSAWSYGTLDILVKPEWAGDKKQIELSTLSELFIPDYVLTGSGASVGAADSEIVTLAVDGTAPGTATNASIISYVQIEPLGTVGLGPYAQLFAGAGSSFAVADGEAVVTDAGAVASDAYTATLEGGFGQLTLLDNIPNNPPPKAATASSQR